MKKSPLELHLIQSLQGKLTWLRSLLRQRHSKPWKLKPWQQPTRKQRVSEYTPFTGTRRDIHKALRKSIEDVRRGHALLAEFKSLVAAASVETAP